MSKQRMGIDWTKPPTGENDLVETIKSYKGRDYDELINAGTTAMMEKLKMNEHKPNFDNVDLYYEYGRLEDEVSEVMRELYDEDIRASGYSEWTKIEKIDYPALRHEFADTAIRCFIAILECDRQIKGE